jgi:hypothetical protein
MTRVLRRLLLDGDVVITQLRTCRIRMMLQGVVMAHGCSQMKPARLPRGRIETHLFGGMIVV